MASSMDEMKSLKWWIPSAHEAILYFILVLLLYIFGSLMFYNSIQMNVKATSRCYKDKKSTLANGTFVANAVNQNNDKLYTVGYNFGAKSYNVQCACPEGKVTNTFPNIDVFDLNTQTVQTMDSKVCACDKQYFNPLAGDTIYYNGYPGVVRFMNTASLYNSQSDKTKKADTTFFDTALNGSL